MSAFMEGIRVSATSRPTTTMTAIRTLDVLDDEFGRIVQVAIALSAVAGWFVAADRGFPVPASLEI